MVDFRLRKIGARIRTLVTSIMAKSAASFLRTPPSRR
jgi:hypothetical protein